MVGAVEDVDGSCVVLAGRTKGEWAAVNAGGSDFAAVKICLSDLDGSASGEEIWRYQVRRKLMVPSVDLEVFSRTCLGGTRVSPPWTLRRQQNVTPTLGR